MADRRCECGHERYFHEDFHGKARTCANCSCPGFSQRKLYTLEEVMAAIPKAGRLPEPDSEWAERFRAALVEGKRRHA